MDEIGFSCNKVEILEKIKQLRTLVRPKSKKSLISATLEIRIQPQFVSFHISGGELKLFCNTKGWGSFTLSLEYFFQVLSDYTGAVFSPTFKDGEMQAGGLFTKGLGFKIQNNHPENKVTLDLPLNYTDLDILKLRHQKSDKQLEIVNAKRLIEQAEERLELNIEIAFKALKSYGIDKDLIRSIIANKIT